MRLAIVAFLMLAVGVCVPVWLVSTVAGNEPDSSVPPVARTYTAADGSGNGHDGVIQGTPTLGHPGQKGTAFSFLKGRSWVQVPSNGDIDPGKRDFLVTAWVRFRDVPGVDETYDILRKGGTTATQGEFALEVIDPGGVRCSVKDRAQRTAAVTSFDIDVSDGDWHAIGCARTGSVLNVIVDGRIASREVMLGSIGNTMPWEIGPRYGWADRSAGRLDEVALGISEHSSPQTGVAGAEKAVRSLFRQLESQPRALWHLDETDVDP